MWPPDKDQGSDDLDDKTFLDTGAGTGIGYQTARALAGLGAKVLLAGRSEAKTRPVIDEIAAPIGTRTLGLLALDLGDQPQRRMRPLRIAWGLALRL